MTIDEELDDMLHSESYFQMADKVMKEGDPIGYLMATFNQFHVGDYDAGLSIFLCAAIQSVKNSCGLQPGLNGPSGSGKSSIVETALHLLPQERIKKTGVSAKALYYMRDLCAGDIIFYDDIQLDPDLRQTFKRMTSNFQQRTKHSVTIKDSKSGEYKTKEYEIPERIIIIMTSVENDEDDQVLNRQLFVSTENDLKHKHDIIDFKKAKFNRAEEQYPVTLEVDVCREIMRRVKSQLYRVKAPKELMDRLEWKDLDNIRNFEKFEDTVKAFAVLRAEQRRVISTVTEGDWPVVIIEAIEDDFVQAIQIYNKRAENQTTGEDATNLKILRCISSAHGEWVFLHQISEQVGLGVETVRVRLHGRNRGKGLLHRVKGLEHHKIPEPDPEDAKYPQPKSVYRIKPGCFDILKSYEQVVQLLPAPTIQHAPTEDVGAKTHEQQPSSNQ